MTAPGEPPRDATLSNRSWRLFLRRALAGRCPRCGEGALFASPFRLFERCAVCELVYRRESGALTGQMYLTSAVSLVFAGALAVGVFLLTDWGTWLSVAVTLPIVVGFSYWLLPRSTAVWVAVEFMTDLGNREPWAIGPANQTRADRIDPMKEDYALLLDSAEKVTADLACNLLEEAGIPTYRHSPDFDIAALGPAAHGAVRGISVFVPPQELGRARALLLEAWGEDGMPKEFMPGESEA